MQEEITLYDEIMILKITDDMDHHYADELKDRVDLTIKSRRIRYLIMDFEGLRFMDSAGIGFIIGRYKLLSKYDGEIYAVNIGNSLDRIFKISGIYRIIRQGISVKAAMKDIKEGVQLT